MTGPATGDTARIVTLWRYPVKSMMGEELDASEISHCGLLGDRAYALIDATDGKVASAKNPRKWPTLFHFRAAFSERPRSEGPLPPIRITLPNGETITNRRIDRHQVLSRTLHRDVTLEVAERGHDIWESTYPDPWMPRAEAYWPDMEEFDVRDTVTDFDLPVGTFFDSAVVHLLTTSTLHRLRDAYPAGRFEVPRFRPNIVLETDDDAPGFPENAWIGRTIAIGEEVRLRITRPCARCVMTTLEQGALPRDTNILRTAVQQNDANVGVYAAVVQGGSVRRGDGVRLVEPDTE